MDFVRVTPPGAELAFVRRRPPEPTRGSGAAAFLHGLGDSASAFGPALEVVSLASLELVLFDMLGHGQSDKPDEFDYAPASHAAVLFQALRKLEVAPPLHLLGYSLGAAVVVELARFPLEGLASLILVEPALDAGRMPFAARVAAQAEADFIRGYPALLSGYGGAGSSEADRRWAETAAFASARAFYRCARGLLQAAKRGELIAHLRELPVPKTFILSRDTYEEWPLARSLEEDGAQVLLVDSPRKMPFYEAPASFYSAVGRALGRPTPPP